MKQLIRYLIWFLPLFAAYNSQAQNNTVYGAGISYTNGVPSWVPNPRTSRAAVDTVTGRWYHFNTPGGWQWIGNTVEEIAGCAAPAYTPSKGDSRLVINNCVKPQVFWYDGAVWKWINQGEVYTAGQGIRIESNTIILDSLNFLDFRTGNALDGDVGRVQWNDTDGTLDLNLKGGNVTLQIGQEEVSLVKHADNSGLIEGRVVYIVGSDGANKTVRYAKADSDATSATTFGLMTESATGGNKAFCTTFGLVRNLNTTNLTEGGIVWLSADTAGTMTAVRPTAPEHGVMVGFCVRKHATQGAIFVQVQNGYELNELHDVFVPSPTNGQVLTWSSTNARWEAITPANQLQTLSTNGSAGNISISSGNTITLNVNDADASTTNELQTLSVAANTATLSNSGGSVTIAGAGINTVGTAGTTITVTGTEVDGSTTNELQTLSTGTNTLTLSNGGGTVTVDTDPTNDVTGSGTSGQVSFWTGTSTQSGDNGLFWDNSLKDLGIGTNTPNTRLDVVGDVEFQNPTTAFDAAIIGAEVLTTGTGISWTGTGYSTGYLHTIGSTDPLTSAFTPVAANYYVVVVTVSGRTTGSISFTFGTNSGTTISSNTTQTNYWIAGSTGKLIITPTTDFNGTVVASVKLITASSAQFTGRSSTGTHVYEERLSFVNSNIFQGFNTGQFNTTGNQNIFQGYQVGQYNTVGSLNVFQGYQAGRFNTTGQQNIFQGWRAGYNNTSGSSNIFQGFSAGQNNLTGIRNIFQGFGAGGGNTSGSNNIFQGASSGNANTIGEYNISSGTNALYSNVDGSNNIVFGYNAGRYIASAFTGNTKLDNSIIIGNDARANNINQANQIVIGYEGRGLGSNTTVLGNSSTTQTWLGGSLTLGTQVTPAARLHVVGSGTSSSTWTAQFHNSAGNNNALMIRDDGRVAMGTNAPNASAILTVTSTTGGILFPRMTTTERNAIATPADGLVIYNTTDNKLQVRAAGAWVDLH